MATSKTDKTATPDLGAIMQSLVDDLRERARTLPGEPGAAPSRLRQQIEQVTAQLRTDQEGAGTDANAQYQQRSDAMQAVLDQRQQRIQAYAERQRQAVPTAPDRFIVAGRVTDQATGAGLPYVRVRATDLDRRKDDVLGETRTDALGYYRIEYAAEDFKDRDKDPETYIQVLDPTGKVLFTSTKSFVQKAGQSAFIPAAIDASRVPVSQRLAQKVGRTVTVRQDDLARRLRVLRFRPELKSLVANAGPITTGPAIKVAVTKPAATTTTTRTAAAKPATTTAEPAASAKPATATAKPAASVAAADPPLAAVKGIGATYRKRLEAAGVRTAGAVAAMKPADLAGILKVGESRAGTIVDAARAAAKSARKTK